MVVVTHAIGFARRVGIRLIFIGHGRIAVDGPRAGLIDHTPNRRRPDLLRHVE